MRLIGSKVDLFFALNTIINTGSAFSITIGGFCYTKPLTGSSIFAYLIYVLVVIVFWSGDSYKCFLGTITVIPLIIYDIYHLLKMRKVEKYFGRKI